MIFPCLSFLALAFAGSQPLSYMFLLPEVVLFWGKKYKKDTEVSDGKCWSFSLACARLFVTPRRRCAWLRPSQLCFHRTESFRFLLSWDGRMKDLHTLHTHGRLWAPRCSELFRLFDRVRLTGGINLRAHSRVDPPLEQGNSYRKPFPEGWSGNGWGGQCPTGWENIKETLKPIHGRVRNRSLIV